MRLNHFTEIDGRQLRFGYTTGTCAALAAAAAARMLLTGVAPETVSLVTPKGIPVTVDTVAPELRDDAAVCGVRKDAGDDPDVTDGLVVVATVRRTAGPGISIDGGEGVGRVTRPGLDQPVGAAAINSGPRRMIVRELVQVAAEHGYGGGWSVVIAVPGGDTVAARTFNSELGVVGGLSIIGTSGIVEPMSSRAILDTIRTELKVIRSEGAETVVLTPGNYGEAYVRSHPHLCTWPRVKCSNHIGEAVDAAVGLRFSGVIVAGHVGKMVKLAGGVMDTHSRVADCRLEMVALHAALVGAESRVVRELLGCATVDAALDALGDALRPAVMDAMVERMELYLRRRVRERVPVGALVFSHLYGTLGLGRTAGGLLGDTEKR
ncbi:MAG: cobalt-precorrin-5B (C(1))-methyltransferase CbiD [Planctomycetaceae bacterium]|nr:cobalt-precorrin-5B (C(1))-methyltransferase CbiD [Planctomycetaceae bacterium]